MPLYELNGKRPTIGEGAWIAPSAEIIGDVVIGPNCWIAFGAVIRGDFGRITIGDGSIIEDNAVIHCARRVDIGARVIVGHMAMIHDAVIHENSLIGMKSMICDDAQVGPWSIVAEQSLVRKNQVVEEGTIYAGSPARKIGPVEDRHRVLLSEGQRLYKELTVDYREHLRRID